MARNDDTVLMEDVRLVFKNFRGEEGQFNREGDRNFGVILPPDLAEIMLADGWNVKYLKPREEDAEEGALPVPWLAVSLSFDKGRPPKVMMITSRNRVALDDRTIEELDWATITHTDLIVRPYHYDVQGRQGIKAYLQTMYVTIEEDALEAKYADRELQ